MRGDADAVQDGSMTYLLEEFVARIQSPVVCRLDGHEDRYRNGEALAQVQFDRPYLVAAIAVEHDAVVLELMENKRMNETAWAGTEQVSFF